MELVKLKKEEFEKFVLNSNQASFYQTYEWGELKKENGWDMHLIGLKDKKKIKAASLILSKNTPIGKKMFYAPRGFIIDYNDFELLKEFTDKVKKYVKKEKGIFIKIDPYISYQERDLHGNIVEDGENNKDCYDNLIKLGYKHFGFNIYQEALQPRWLFVTKTKNTTIDEVMKKMDSKTRQILRKNKRLGIVTREIGYDELDKFKDIMQHTGDRRDFIDRPLKYYQDMYNHLHESGILKILVAEIDTKLSIKNMDKEILEIKLDMEAREAKYLKDPAKMNKNKYEQKQKECENNIKRINKNKVHILELKKEYGDKILLGGILFLIYGDEVLSLVGGSYDKLMEFQSAYTVHFAGMKYAIENNFSRYNFYGITGDFEEKKNPLFGLYSFKRDFGGQVVELIGEFDFVVDKFFFFVYKVAFKSYKLLKNIKNKLRKK